MKLTAKKILESFQKSPHECMKDYLFLTNQYADKFADGNLGFVLNTSNIFFYNSNRIWYLDLKKLQTNMQFKYLGLVIDKEQSLSKINKIRTGSVDDKIVIKVR